MNIQKAKYDFSNDVEIEPSIKWISQSKFISPKKDVDDYLKDISETLSILSMKLGKMIVMTDLNVPWLFQENSYPPAKQALDFLKEKIDTTFDGGFILDKNDIQEYLVHIFWLIRCNAALPTVYLGFVNGQSILELCKYGVLHVEFYNAAERSNLMEIFNSRQFHQINDCSDPVNFDDFEGRKISMT